MANDEQLVARLRAAGCVFAEEEAAELRSAAGPDSLLLEKMTVRRVAGEPLEYVVGRVRFDGHLLRIDPGVFIPRRRTEWLVEVADRELASRVPVIVDMGCGTGAIGFALAVRRGAGAELHATDVDPTAVACARANLLGIGGSVHVGDLDTALPRTLVAKVDVMLANLPYVPSSEVALMPIDSRGHEPLFTTDGGPDGLDLVRRIADRATYWLKPGGRLLIEVGDESTGQPDIATAILEAAGLDPRVHVDTDRRATVASGTAPTNARH